MSPEVIDSFAKAFIGLMVGIALFFVRDFRRTRIENKLSEETVAPKTHKVGIEALDVQILAMSKAWELERKSLERRIQSLEDELVETNSELENEKSESDVRRRDLREARRELKETRDALEEVRAELRAIQVSWTTRGDGNA